MCSIVAVCCGMGARCLCSTCAPRPWEKQQLLQTGCAWSDLLLLLLLAINLLLLVACCRFPPVKRSRCSRCWGWTRAEGTSAWASLWWAVQTQRWWQAAGRSGSRWKTRWCGSCDRRLFSGGWWAVCVCVARL